MKKVRDIVPGPLPAGKLRKGEVVLSPVGPRRYLGKWLAVGRTLLKAHQSARKSIADLLFRGDLSWGAKIERINAECCAASAKELYTPETMHLAGFLRANCRCAPGYGHKAAGVGAPSDAVRKRKRAERRRTRKGSRR